ncbi:PREDICTED: protein MIS12 homolog [Nelumbo nucifera]|nr:PREDICTED: protein MIS12 homolog [Nelumbo nucifera]
MEGSKSEAVFESLNLNPQLFINEVLNTVDDMVDGAFEFYEQQALTFLGNAGEDKSVELKKGISYIRNIIQSGLDKRLDMWEKYCLRHCFVVPEGFSLPKLQESAGESTMGQDSQCDGDLDSQLQSLREKLFVVGNEGAELYRELQELETQSVLSKSCVMSLKEASQLFEQNSVNDTVKEMARTASELHVKMEKLKIKRMEEIGRYRTGRIYNPERDESLMDHINGLCNAKLEDLQEFAADLNI